MRFFSILFFLVFAWNVHAQVGISAQYNLLNAPQWTPIFNTSTTYDFGNDYRLPNTTGLAIDYWLRPLDLRIEFLPRLSYWKIEDTISNNFSLSRILEHQAVLLSLPIHFYPLDIEGDCDCPTWGKDGSLIKKGFFLSLHPGVGFFNYKNSFEPSPTISTASVNKQQLRAHLGIGAGLDIGMAKFLTITPYLNYIRHFDVDWDRLVIDLAPSDEALDGVSNINQFLFGLRVGIHLKS